MKPPKNIKVGPYRIRIRPDVEHLRDLERDGDTSFPQGLIRYTTASSTSVRRSTILHEVLHAVANAAGIDETVRLKQEDFIGRIEAGLLGVLRENPKLIDYLVADLA